MIMPRATSAAGKLLESHNDLIVATGPSVAAIFVAGFKPGAEETGPIGPSVAGMFVAVLKLGAEGTGPTGPSVAGIFVAGFKPGAEGAGPTSTRHKTILQKFTVTTRTFQQRESTLIK